MKLHYHLIDLFRVQFTLREPILISHLIVVVFDILLFYSIIATNFCTTGKNFSQYIAICITEIVLKNGINDKMGSKL